MSFRPDLRKHVRTWALVAFVAPASLLACGSDPDPAASPPAASAGGAGSSAAGAGGAGAGGGAAGTAGTQAGGGGGAAGSSGSAGSAGSAGAKLAEPLARLVSFLKGDFDNSAQHAKGFSKLVERHVCDVPGHGDGATVWLYVEQVEIVNPDTPNAKRDAYYTRINQISLVDGVPVAKIYKLVAGHPLASDAFKFNGPRDGCNQPGVLAAIKDAELTYRTGCDVTFVDMTTSFGASTMPGSCAISPGTYIETKATITMDGLTTKDTVSGQGDEFVFLRVLGFTYP